MAELPRISGKHSRGPAVTVWVDGAPISAFQGESLAAALLAAGHLRLRTSPGGKPRGAFCHIGICQECLVECDGLPVAACQTPCSDGLTVTLRSLTDDDH